jgi:hypothetical protein
VTQFIQIEELFQLSAKRLDLHVLGIPLGPLTGFALSGGFRVLALAIQSSTIPKAPIVLHEKVRLAALG